MRIAPEEHEAARASSRTGNAASAILAAGGIVLFLVLVRDVGVAAVLTNIRIVGLGIVPIVLQEILAFSANTLGWRAAFPPPRPRGRCQVE